MTHVHARVAVLAAFLAAGCSPLLYPGAYRLPPVAPKGQASLPSPLGRWDVVMRLPAQSTIDVLTRDGRASVGLFTGADEQNVRMAIQGVEVAIQRQEVVRIDLVDLPGSDAGAVAKKAAGGALIGMAGAAILGGVLGGSAWPPPGELWRAGAAIGGLAGGHGEMSRRSARIIYLAPSTHWP